MVASEASATGSSVSPSSLSPTARGTQVPLPSGIARSRGTPKRPLAPGLKRIGEGGMTQSSSINPRPSQLPSVAFNMASSSIFSGAGVPRASDPSCATRMNQTDGTSPCGVSVFSAPYLAVQASDVPDTQDSPVEQGKSMDDQKKCTRCRKQKFYKYCAYRHCRSCCFSRRDTCPAHLKVLGYSGNFGPQRNTNPGCADCTHYLADQRCSFQRCRECCLRRHLPCPSHNQYCVSVSEPFWPSPAPLPQPSAQDVNAAAAAAAAATFAYDFHSSSMATMLNAYAQQTQPSVPLPPAPVWPPMAPSAPLGTAPCLLPPTPPAASHISPWLAPPYLHQQLQSDPFSLYIPAQAGCSPSTPSPSSSNSSPSTCSSIASSGNPDSPGFSIPFFRPNASPSTVTGPTTWGCAASHFRPSPNTSPHSSFVTTTTVTANAFPNPNQFNFASSNLPLYGFDDPYGFLHILGDEQRASP